MKQMSWILAYLISPVMILLSISAIVLDFIEGESPVLIVIWFLVLGLWIYNYLGFSRLYRNYR